MNGREKHLHDRMTYSYEPPDNSRHSFAKRRLVLIGAVVLVLLIVAASIFITHKVNNDNTSKATDTKQTQNIAGNDKTKAEKGTKNQSLQPEANGSAVEFNNTLLVFSLVVIGILFIVMGWLLYLLSKRLKNFEDETRRKITANINRIDDIKQNQYRLELKMNTFPESFKQQSDQNIQDSINSRDFKTSNRPGSPTSSGNRVEASTTNKPSNLVNNGIKPVSRLSQFDSYKNELVSDYNNAAHKQDPQIIKKKYKPVVIEVNNCMERLQNPSIPATFALNDDGPFYAVDGQNGKYFVVPKIGIVITDQNYKSAAFTELFDCDGYRAGEKSSRVYIDAPAVLELRPGGEWKPSIIGKLRISYE